MDLCLDVGMIVVERIGWLENKAKERKEEGVE